MVCPEVEVLRLHVRQLEHAEPVSLRVVVPEILNHCESKTKEHLKKSWRMLRDS